MIDGFLLKKVVSVFIHFIPGVLIVLLLSLLIRRWKPRLSYGLSLVLCLILIASSVPAVSNRMVASIENQFPVLAVAPDDTGLILVLGFAHIVADGLPINSQLYPVALSRLTEGVRLWKTKPDTILALSGAPPVPGTHSHAEKMHEMALELGVPEERIIRFDDTLDTEDEINSAAAWLKNNRPVDNRLVVVSTAMHLPRAELLFNDLDVVHTMAPTEFTVSNSGLKLPSAYAMLSVDRVIHEWIGMLWYRLKSLFS